MADEYDVTGGIVSRLFRDAASQVVNTFVPTSTIAIRIGAGWTPSAPG
jgi:hypothetical protein